MSNQTKIAVLVSGGGTNLQALINAEKSGVLTSGTISLVIADKEEAYALVRAKEAGIPTRAVVKKSFSSKEAFEKALTDTLSEFGIEVIVLAGFMCILSEDFTKKFPKRILNVHPSLIPSFCGEGFFGLRVHEAALSYGVKVTGATVHYVNEIADGGEIILQKAVAIQEGDTPEILQRRVMEEAEWILLPQAAELVSRRIREEKTPD
ncbi:MAG: phosphoribosylglycinamide formyltransferase [Clostridia bacterium]|nr:phosphoribosylglycinamide formyltransferase [Clostridia bacterium]